MAHYHIRKSPAPVPVLSLISAAHDCPPYFSKVHFNIILQSALGSSKWCLSIRSPHQNPLYTSPVSQTCHVPLHRIILDIITQIIYSEEYTHKVPHHSPVTSSFLGPNILLSPLFSNTLITGIITIQHYMIQGTNFIQILQYKGTNLRNHFYM